MNQKSVLLSVGAILCLTLVISLIIAESDMNSLRKDELKTAYENIKCKTDFSINVIDSITEKYPSDSLDAYSVKLSDKLDKLNELANSGDWKSFKEFLTMDFNSNFKSSRVAVGEWRADNYKNMTKEEKETLKEDYLGFKESFEECHLDTLKMFGTGRVTSFEAILKGYQQRIDVMQEKGADVAGLNIVIEEANKVIIDPMKADLELINSTKRANDIVKKYCLFDGCVNGINYHLAARYEIAKQEVALIEIKKMISATEYNIPSDKVAVIEKSIAESKRILGTIGVGTYTETTKKQLWLSIRASNSAISDIMININDQKKTSTELSTEEGIE